LGIFYAVPGCILRLHCRKSAEHFIEHQAGKTIYQILYRRFTDRSENSFISDPLFKDKVSKIDTLISLLKGYHQKQDQMGPTFISGMPPGFINFFLLIEHAAIKKCRRNETDT
jgi:hypothetical protein